MKSISLFLIIFILSLAGLSFSFSASAQQETSFRNINVSDGLPQGFISGIIQDKAGFIWISTHNGLARYDGRKFKIFQADAADSTTLENNTINNIFSDSRNIIWILYQDGQIDLMDPVTEQLTHLTRHKDYKKLKSFPSIHQCFFEDSRHVIWMGTENGIAEINLKSEPHARIHTCDWGFDNLLIRGITENSEGHIFFITKKEIVETYPDGKITGHSDFTPEEAALLEKNLVEKNVQNRFGLSIRLKGRDSIFFTGKEALLVYDKKNKKLSSLTGQPAHSFTVWRTNQHPSCFFFRDKTSIYYYSFAEETFFKAGNYDTNIQATPMMAFIDRSGMLWCGTNGYGIFLKPLHNTGFVYQKSGKYFQEDILNSLFGENMTPQETTTFPTMRLRWTIHSNGEIFFLDRYKKFSKKISAGYICNNRLSSKSWKLPFEDTIALSTIDFDNRGNLWGIDGLRRLLKLNEDGSVTVVKSGMTTRTPHDISHILHDNDSSLWITSTHGLYHYGIYNDNGQAFRKSNKKNGLSSDLLMSIVQDDFDKNILWIGTLDDGLIRMNKREATFTSFNQHNGFPDNSIYAIQKDKAGYLWCSTNKGIFRFNTKNLSAQKFYDANGFPEQEFNRFHDLQMADGRIAFGGSAYYIVFDPLRMKADDYNPEIAVTGIKINNREADPKAARPLFTKSINSLDALTLQYNQNFLTVQYAALQYDFPERMEYRHKLEGLDNDWIYTGNDNTAQYTNLPPGNYKLLLNATNTSGKWSGCVKTLAVSILPPWWRTWWAYSVYVIAMAGGSWWLFQNRLKHAGLKQSIVMQQKEAAQLRAVDEMKDRFFSNITHELRTPLSLIISPAQHYLEHPEQLKDTTAFLQTINTNAAYLLRLINQLLDMSKLEAGNMQLSFSNGNISSYTEQAVRSFNMMAVKKNIALRFSANTDKSYLFDTDKWEKIIYNLLSNAIKFTPEGGSVSLTLTVIELYPDSHLLQCKISDTGIGIPAKHLPFIFDRFYQADDAATRKYEGTGIGLALVKELVQLMHGEISAESQPGKGTCFTMNMKLDLAAASGVSNDTLAPSFHEMSPAAAIPATAADIPEYSENAPLILIIEDNVALCSFINECLSPYYKTITANDGKKGWGLALKHLPDIIVSDLMMPGMDGFELCDKVKNTPDTAHIAFLVLSAKAAYQSRIRGLSKGADDYLSKPFHVEELLLRVRNILARQETLRNRYARQLQPETNAPEVNKTGDDFLKKIYTIIEQHLSDSDLDVAKLAEKMLVSKSTLNRKLGAIIGLSASEVIRKYRLKKAAAFLKAGKNVSETAYLTGFETPSYFSSSFKEMYGVPPSEYAVMEK